MRLEAARSAIALGRLDASDAVALGESQAYQVRSALELYHYINPKLLLLVAMVRRELKGESGSPAAQPDSAVESVERGFPMRMYAMEMEDPQPDDDVLNGLLAPCRTEVGKLSMILTGFAPVDTGSNKPNPIRRNRLNLPAGRRF